MIMKQLAWTSCNLSLQKSLKLIYEWITLDTSVMMFQSYTIIYIYINYCCSTNAKSHSYSPGHLNFHIREHTHSKFDSTRKRSKSRKNKKGKFACFRTLEQQSMREKYRLTLYMFYKTMDLPENGDLPQISITEDDEPSNLSVSYFQTNPYMYISIYIQYIVI